MNSLIVEDDPTARFILGKWLEKFGPIETVSNGMEGLDAFSLSLDSGYPFQLVTMDINMPGLNGLEALKRLRQMERDKGVSHDKRCKVLMATSEETSSSVMTSFREECDGYMTKPFHRKALLEHLEKMGLLKDTSKKSNLGRELRCLIVEDDRNTRFILNKWMSNKGSCDQVDDGKQGLEKFINQRESDKPYDLILLDINMPEMSGIDVLRGIRDYERGLDLESGMGAKVIMVTSEGKSAMVFKAFGENCDGYLTKPLSKNKMVDLLEKLGLSS